ncbi:hypothetical protein HYT52_05025 [Candidatus Woesearchaeota archaeon]|nr:hypothetical protein [Candidatus Woesearchaeota archaeon]
MKVIKKATVFGLLFCLLFLGLILEGCSVEQSVPEPPSLPEEMDTAPASDGSNINEGDNAVLDDIPSPPPLPG